MDIVELSQEDPELAPQLRCPFCRAGLTDSGGCKHVVYTHTTMDGFLERSDLVESVVADLTQAELEKLLSDDPELSEEDVELGDEDVMAAIAKSLGAAGKRMTLFRVSAVFGSTASYLVSE